MSDTEFDALVPQPELENASLKTVLESIEEAYIALQGLETFKRHYGWVITFQDFMNIYAMLPYYKDVVIAVEEYEFVRRDM